MDPLPTEPTLGTVEKAFSQWAISAGQFCYTAEYRPTPTARWICVSTTLAGLISKLIDVSQESG